MNAAGPFPDKNAVEVAQLTLARGARVLIEGLSFRAEPGEYVELRGANGTGKTSLLRAIAGFLRPKGGQVRIHGAEEPALALHYVAHQNGLKGAASVRGHLRYWAGLFGAPLDEAAALDQLGLARQADLPARVLSQGQARRLALTRLVIAPRPIWLLDEPAAALDAEGRAVLAGLIEAHRARGGIALAAVHEALGPAPSREIVLGLA
ncbi:MAG TPA: heme ABC exporter ATP-binding protein CcmA [Terricaulis sp.]|nr:heme ABC exporter ATP-binding protein CcmA [Terricaulis sp.]